MPKRTSQARRRKQAELPFHGNHGGARPGASRKPNGSKPGMATRPKLAARHPVLITVKLRQGLLIRAARALDKLCQRRGSVFADRYHDRTLTSPRAMRNGLCYVLANGKKHAAEGRAVRVTQAIDIYSSAPWFDGFREAITVRGIAALAPPVTPPRTWLLSIGWRRRGLLSVFDLPAVD